MTALSRSIALSLLVGCSTCEPGSDPDPEPRGQAPEPQPPTLEPERTTVEPDERLTRLDPPTESGLALELAASDEGVIATWFEPEGEGHVLRLARLRGPRWSTPTAVRTERSVASWADRPRAAVAADGSVYLTAPEQGEAEGRWVRVFRSEDGARFEDLGLLHDDRSETEHGFVSLLPEGEGVRAFWLDGRRSLEGGPTDVRSATVGPQGVSGERVLDERTCDCCNTDAALTAAGPRVVFRDRSEAEIRDVAIAALEGEAEAVHQDGWEFAGCPVNGPAIAAEGDRMAVSWFTGVDGGRVAIAFAAGGGEAGGGEAALGDALVIDDDEPVGRPDLVMVDGGAVVIWVGGDDVVRLRFVSSEGAMGPALVVAHIGERGGFPALARDTDRLVIGYPGDRRPRVATLDLDRLPRDPS